MRKKTTTNKNNNVLKCFEASIIAGSAKGKKILIPNISTTRSSKGILRESLFNTLQFDIIDKNFVEVFAGSGSVGLEALSRGAKRAFFIEQNRDVFDILKQNIKRVNADNATAILGDSFEEFDNVLNSITKLDEKTYFYFDPPFSIREGMDSIYDKTLSLIKSIDPNISEMIIIEHMSQLKLPKQIGEFKLTKKKKFGKSTLSYFLS